MYRPNGLGVALITPMTEQLAVDEPALRRLVEHLIRGGIDFLVPCGTTGESATLSAVERLRVISIVLEVSNGQVPVVAGAGGNNTAAVVRHAMDVEKLGVHGILSISPYYNKPPQEGIYRHFAAISEAVSCGITLYNCPGRTGSNISPETVLRLAKLPGIVAVKEASGDLSQITRLIREAPEGFSVLSGDDAITLLLLATGAHGVISVVGNEVPGMMKEMVLAALADEISKARSLHQRLLPLMEANFLEANPIPVKTAMAMMGLCEAHVRLPLVPMSDEQRVRLASVLEELALLSGGA